nr:hypothetical protein [Tanacetum cinerariifolium]
MKNISKKNQMKRNLMGISMQVEGQGLDEIRVQRRDFITISRTKHRKRALR